MRLARCGDGILQGDEECDDGNNDDGDQCCTNLSSSPLLMMDCSRTVKSATMAMRSTMITARWRSTPLVTVLQPASRSRGGIRSADQRLLEHAAALMRRWCPVRGQACDDGNQSNHDDCTTNCQSRSVVMVFATRQGRLDDGNRVDNDVCTNSCELPRCGDGIRQPWEPCDDGNREDDDACSNRCQPPAVAMV